MVGLWLLQAPSSAPRKRWLLISASDTHPCSESFTSIVNPLISTAYMWSAYHWPMELNYYLSSCFRENVDSSSHRSSRNRHFNHLVSLPYSRQRFPCDALQWISPGLNRIEQSTYHLNSLDAIHSLATRGVATKTWVTSGCTCICSSLFSKKGLCECERDEWEGGEDGEEFHCWAGEWNPK